MAQTCCKLPSFSAGTLVGADKHNLSVGHNIDIGRETGLHFLKKQDLLREKRALLRNGVVALEGLRRDALDEPLAVLAPLDGRPGVDELCIRPRAVAVLKSADWYHLHVFLFLRTSVQE